MRTNIDFSIVQKRALHLRKRTQNFQSELVRVFSDENSTIKTEFLNERRICNVDLSWVVAPDLDQFSIEFHEIINGHRAILDNLIFLIANGSSPKLTKKQKRQLSFPLFRTVSGWEKGNATMDLLRAQCDPKFLELIKHLQPFRSNVNFENGQNSQNPLLLLHELDIAGKHHVPKIVISKLNTLKVNAEILFFSEEETDVPSCELFGDAILSGGIIQTFTSTFPIKKIGCRIDFAGFLGIDDFNLLELLGSFEVLTETVVLNFIGFNDLEDWESPEQL
ncbi:MAG: hypothetical protein V3U96_03790 [Paracoccaceae bacterium]